MLFCVGRAGAEESSFPNKPRLEVSCSAEQEGLVRRLVERDSAYLPKSPWGNLWISEMQADEDFLVVRITGYTSGRDANTFFVYQPGEQDWYLSCILDIENAGSCCVQLVDDGELRVSVVPMFGESQRLPYVHSFDIPEAQKDVPRLSVTPEGVALWPSSPSVKPESVQVYMRLQMSGPLDMYIVSMDTDATPEAMSLETLYYIDGEAPIQGGEHWDDVFVGDKEFDAAEFLRCAEQLPCFQNHLLPREAVLPGSIEIGWAYDEVHAQWVLLLRHENGRTWCYDFKQGRFVPSSYAELPFAWKIEPEMW